jgi:hypothetical protein
MWYLVRSGVDLRPEYPSRSHFQCQGDSRDTRRCVFHNVVVQDGVFWLEAPDPRDPSAAPPSLLCSTTNGPEKHTKPCDVRFAADAFAWRTLLDATTESRRFATGVALYRLNPGNAYHVLFEDMIPIVANLLDRTGGTAVSDSPGHADVKQHQARAPWGLFVTDRKITAKAMEDKFWNELLPEVTVVHPTTEVYHVDTLLAGSGVPCSHWGLCRPTNRPVGLFDPPDAAITFRHLVFHRYGIQEEAPNAMSLPRQNPPRITLVQRTTTRRIRNLQEVQDAVKAGTGTVARLVDMAELSLREQISLSHDTDIYVLVHGGALANTLWLPPRALIIDIYPHGFMVSGRSALLHSIRKALEPAFAVGHLPFQVENTPGQEILEGPLAPGCVCSAFECQSHVFHTSAWIHIDPDRFQTHMQEALHMWREANYTRPISPEEFRLHNNAEQARRDAAAAAVGAPVCWKKEETEGDNVTSDHGSPPTLKANVTRK